VAHDAGRAAALHVKPACACDPMEKDSHGGAECMAASRPEPAQSMDARGSVSPVVRARSFVGVDCAEIVDAHHRSARSST
jgi:hypothetical protein